MELLKEGISWKYYGKKLKGRKYKKRRGSYLDRTEQNRIREVQKRRSVENTLLSLLILRHQWTFVCRVSIVRWSISWLCTISRLSHQCHTHGLTLDFHHLRLYITCLVPK